MYKVQCSPKIVSDTFVKTLETETTLILILQIRLKMVK